MVTAGFPSNEAIIVLGLMVSTEFKDLYAFELSSIPTPLIVVLFRAFYNRDGKQNPLVFHIMTFNINVIMKYTVFLDTSNINVVLFC